MSVDSEDPYYLQMYEETYNIYYIFDCFEGKRDLWSPLIKPSMYQKALSEFVRYGRFVKFPIKYVFQWAKLCVKNCCLLYSSTVLRGRTELSPAEDVVNYYFDGDWEQWAEYIGEHYDKFINSHRSDIYGWEYSHRFLEKKKIYDWLRLPNGDIAVSDYAWDCGDVCYNDILPEINMEKSPEELIVLVNRILDVGHMSGDLASAFIEDGSKSLCKISERGYITE